MSRPTPHRLAVTSLSFVHPDGHPLLHDITFGLTDERVGLVGPNGAGKSTLLALIAGVVPVTRGHITTDGACAFVPQRTTMAGERSGGEQTRVDIADALRSDPRLLVLDEPSDHLDDAGRRWLYGLVRRWPHGLLVATHDRELLQHVDRILELRDGRVRSFGGAWSAFAAAQRAERERLAQTVAHAEAALARTVTAVQQVRERKAHADARGRRSRSTGSQPPLVLNAGRERAQGSDARQRAIAARLRDTAMDAVREAKAAEARRTPPRLPVPAVALPAHTTVVAIEAGRVAVAGRTVLDRVTLRVRGPERLALVGPNGCGKTSLLRVVVGEQPLVAGVLHRAVSASHLAWVTQGDVSTRATTSVFDFASARRPEASRKALHAVLARAGFRGDACGRRVHELSGGESVRLRLALALASDPAPLALVLDEPTNHLDLESIALLEQVLTDYRGAVLLASHDRAFRDAVRITREVDVAAWSVR